MGHTATPTYVIVGAGHAGGKAAETLRQEGFDGRIVLIGAEDELPYQRPPLSKEFLTGDAEKSTIYLHDQQWYQANSVELRTDRHVTDIDRDNHAVLLADGERIDYDKLLLTTGAIPRRLDVPGAQLEGVHYLRQASDSERLASALSAGGKVVVIGAGWIGMETAAAARQYGCEVTIVEAQPAPLRGPLGDEMGEYFANVHRQHGVKFRFAQHVMALEGEGHVRAVSTPESTVEADTVIVALGVRPNTDVAQRCGLQVDDGIVVNSGLRTEDPAVYSAGDVASAFHPRYDQRLRVEHWNNAEMQSAAAARSMLGHKVSYEETPFFFTDQYDIGMEFCGWFPPGGYDSLITRGDVSGDAFAAFWVSGSQVVAGMHVNLWDDGIEPIQSLVDSGRPIDTARLANPDISLHEVFIDN